jgi:hypothetical protein
VYGRLAPLGPCTLHNAMCVYGYTIQAMYWGQGRLQRGRDPGRSRSGARERRAGTARRGCCWQAEVRSIVHPCHVLAGFLWGAAVSCFKLAVVVRSILYIALRWAPDQAQARLSNPATHSTYPLPTQPARQHVFRGRAAQGGH